MMILTLSESRLKYQMKWVSLCRIYQILARLWNGTDIHGLPLNGIDEASFSYSDGTDDMHPSG